MDGRGLITELNLVGFGVGVVVLFVMIWLLFGVNEGEEVRDLQRDVCEELPRCQKWECLNTAIPTDYYANQYSVCLLEQIRSKTPP